MERTVVFTDEALIKEIEACQDGERSFSETVMELCRIALTLGVITELEK